MPGPVCRGSDIRNQPDGGQQPVCDLRQWFFGIGGGWKDELIGVAQGMTADAFERLCQRILRDSGFLKVEVTGRSGDRGIDGVGVLRVGLLSFHAYFQCKKWKGNVRAKDTQDFRGAMAGRTKAGSSPPDPTRRMP